MDTLRKNEGEPLRPVPVCLPLTLVRRLDKQREQHGRCSRSSLIRLACEQLLAREEQPHK